MLTASLPLRVFLYVCAVAGGGSVLVLEIIGARMLTPYFGSSHFVWTAQIAVTLLALAAGYWLGGRGSMRAPDRLMVAALLLAGSLTVLAPFLVRFVSL